MAINVTQISPGLAFKEHHWDQLLSQIHDRTVVPIIGPELIEITIDGQTSPLNYFLARRMAELLLDGLPALGASFPTLEEGAYAYRRHHDRDPADIYACLYNLLTLEQWPTPEPLRKLAEISDFDLYVTTTFDDLMKQALSERPSPVDVKALAYSKVAQYDDLPPARCQEGTVFLYQLFGRVRTVADYVVTDDDMLEICHRLQAKDYRPANLFKRLGSSNLLLLGCGFPDWLARFLLYAARGDGILRDGVSGVVADRRIADDKDLLTFLERRRTKIFDQGGSPEFVDELHARWMSRYGNVKPISSNSNSDSEGILPFEEDAFFLSYASDDIETAFVLAKALEEKGLPFWLDKKQLQPGDKYGRIILQNIERSSFFIPLISGNTADPDRRWFRLEWNKALEEAGKVSFDPSANKFILPLTIDGTEPDADFLGGTFDGLHWHSSSKDKISDEFLEHCVSLFRARRGSRRKRP